MRTALAQRVVLCAALALPFANWTARAQSGHEPFYQQHNLVSDIPGLADRTDSNLVNAWGTTHSATSPWWINANGTGVSLVYDGAGAPFPAANPLIVTIPAPGGGTSAPTGIAFNPTTEFQLTAGNPARFLFASEDGAIAGWNPAVNPTTAVIKVDHSATAVYKGLTLGQMGAQNLLYAANFHDAVVEVYDGAFNPASLPQGAFSDPEIPAGFAPFNVQNVGGNIFVTYAKQDEARHDDVAGPGLGYVDEFTPAGALVRRLEHGPWLNSPWAVTMAPATGFGKLSGSLLVGNFGSGQIASYSPSGEFEGLMRGRRGKPITIDGLWGLGFGNDATAGPSTTLFFAAGIQDEAHGLFGTLTPAENPGKGHDK
jgi:uncharacterized protein (TIGR03118 family)